MERDVKLGVVEHERRDPVAGRRAGCLLQQHLLQLLRRADVGVHLVQLIDAAWMTVGVDEARRDGHLFDIDDVCPPAGEVLDVARATYGNELAVFDRERLSSGVRRRRSYRRARSPPRDPAQLEIGWTLSCASISNERPNPTGPPASTALSPRNFARVIFDIRPSCCSRKFLLPVERSSSLELTERGCLTLELSASPPTTTPPKETTRGQSARITCCAARRQPWRPLLGRRRQLPQSRIR